MAGDQYAHAFMVLGRDGMLDRTLEVTRILQPHARPAVQNGNQLGLAAPELVEQQVREEVMEAIEVILPL
jgi:hypothetical protein